MFNKSVVILLSGKAGVGKTTCAKFLESYDSNLVATTASMAMGLKEIAKNVFGWDGVKDSKGRSLLQNLGRVGREYNPDFWVNLTFDKYLPSLQKWPFDLILVDDWRFPNEYDYLKTKPLYQVYRARIIAPEREILAGTLQYNDVSETALSDKDEYDFYINNSGSMKSLESSLAAIHNYIVLTHTFGGTK